MTHNRILVFSTDDHLHPAGGAEQAFGNITERLPHIEFDLICAKLRKEVSGYEKVKNVNIHRMGFGIPKVDGIILALFGHFCAQKLMKKNRYDLMWSMMASYGAFSAVRVKQKTGLPFLLTLQEGDALEYIYNRVKYVRKSFNRIFQSADGIQAISHFLLNWGREMGYKGDLGRVIPNGVALDAYTKVFDAKDIDEARRSFGFPSQAFILYSASRLEKKNGVGDIIEALPLLPQHVCLVVCGGGSLEGVFRARIAVLGLESRVKLLGFVEPHKLPLLLAASDTFIRPSLSEGLGSAFLEAMGGRKIAVGTNAGGIPDFLKDGETGFMVDIENPKSIAETMLRIMALNTEEKNAILDRAERMVRETYNWDFVARDMEQMFNQVIVCKQ